MQFFILLPPSLQLPLLPTHPFLCIFCGFLFASSSPAPCTPAPCSPLHPLCPSKIGPGCQVGAWLCHPSFQLAYHLCPWDFPSSLAMTSRTQLHRSHQPLFMQAPFNSAWEQHCSLFRASISASHLFAIPIVRIFIPMD